MSAILTLIIDTIWFFLPAIIANTIPVFAARYNWTPFLNKPIDGGAKLKTKRLLGDHKTWRGLILGTLFGTLAGILQGRSPLLSLALSFGALAGDAGKSFLKRRLDINPGGQWIVFDQVDYVIGAALFASIIKPVPLEYIFTAIIILGIGSALTSFIGYKLHIKKSF